MFVCVFVCRCYKLHLEVVQPFLSPSPMSSTLRLVTVRAAKNVIMQSVCLSACSSVSLSVVTFIQVQSNLETASQPMSAQILSNPSPNASCHFSVLMAGIMFMYDIVVIATSLQKKIS